MNSSSECYVRYKVTILRQTMPMLIIKIPNGGYAMCRSEVKCIKESLPLFHIYIDKRLHRSRGENEIVLFFPF